MSTIPPQGWAERQHRAEVAWRSLGNYTAANHCRQHTEAVLSAIAAGRSHVDNCEWYDRGAATLFELIPNPYDSGWILRLGPYIQVGVQRDQLRDLMEQAVSALMPRPTPKDASGDWLASWRGFAEVIVNWVEQKEE